MKSINFNCTIQELKLFIPQAIFCRRYYFNCTIQELKLGKWRRWTSESLKFQLHHTGIKTRSSDISSMGFWRFQLHHTGIKTECHVQLHIELKRFQLHHTGIKTTGHLCAEPLLRQFQLHHTGIKTIGFYRPLPAKQYFNCTIQELKQLKEKFGKLEPSISIAPYRN